MPNCEMVPNRVPAGSKGPGERTQEIVTDLPHDYRSAVRLRAGEDPTEPLLTEQELFAAYGCDYEAVQREEAPDA